MWFFSDESSFRILQKRITKLEIFDVLKGSFYFKQANEAASYHEKMQQFLSDWDSFELGRDLTNLLPEQIQPAEDIFERYKSHDPTLKFVLERGGYLYDAVAAAGLIACREFPSLRINRSSFAPRFLNGSLGLKLAGLTGDLEFTENGNRKESTGRLQMLNLETISGWGYSFQPVGIFHIETSEFDFQCTVCKPPVYNGGRVEKPVNIESPVENMNYDSALGIVTFLMFVANCIPAASAFIFCRVHRDHPVVKAAQPLFMNVICLGAIISSFSLIPLAFTDQAGPKANGSGGNAFASSGCGLSWWLYCIGFMFTFTPLFLKMNRAYNILYDTSYRSHKITDRSMVISILLFTSVDVIFLTAWGVYDPMVYVRKVTYNEYSQPVNSVGACASETSAYFIGVILFYHVSILAYTSFIAYKASNVNTAFSEAKYITISIYSSLQLLVLGLPLAVIVMDIPNLSVYVRLGIVFLNDFSVQVAIFGPKLYFYKYGASMDGVGGDMVAVSYERQKRIEAKKKSSGASSSAKTSSE
uniref:G-protein coupled receptors family 3 profile domain-containing protein n=1 Tax=Mucochytrium quahogii TaxID=96639 RepID=A0A7S2S7K3_9STRA